MSKFGLKEIEGIQGKLKVFKLEIDTLCQFDEFEAQIEADSNLSKQLNTVYSRMNDVANLKMLPKNKFRDISRKKSPVKEFEIKTVDLRVYLIKDFNRHIIILGGKKNTQKKDIKKFHSTTDDYLSQ